jgi:hypothetical protein
LGLESLNLNNSLEDYANLKKKTNLHSLEESFLEEFSFNNQIETLDNQQKCLNLEMDIEALEHQIENDAKEIQLLERFL